MVSKLKEVTIDVGPQPVKFSRFSSIPLSTLLKLLPDEQLQALNLNSSDIEGIQTAIDCLLVVTEIAFEVWVIKNQSLSSKFIDIDCIFRKQEVGVEYIDFVHICPLKS